jgi:hypothetical protein
MREQAERLRAEARDPPPVRHDARAQEAVIESVLADRERLALPPLVSPRLPTSRQSSASARAIRLRPGTGMKRCGGVESYRLRNNVKDKGSALGAKPKEPGKAREHDLARRRVERAQRQLRLQHHIARQRARERRLGLGRGIGR